MAGVAKWVGGVRHGVMMDMLFALCQFLTLLEATLCLLLIAEHLLGWICRQFIVQPKSVSTKWPCHQYEIARYFRSPLEDLRKVRVNMFCAFCAPHRLLNDYDVETLLWRVFFFFFTFSKSPFHVNCVSKRLQANNRVLCHIKRMLKSTQYTIMNFY